MNRAVKRIYTQKESNGNTDIMCDGVVIAWLDREYLTLRNLRFWPEGEILVHLQQICWTVIPNNTHPLWNAENAMLGFSETEDGGILLRIETDSQKKELSNSTWLKIFYSNEKQCLVYSVKQDLKVNKEYRWFSAVRCINGVDYVTLEYTDPYLFHITGPAVPVKGFWPGIWLPGQECDAREWRKRWQMFIYEREDGILEGCRHSHCIHPFPVKVKRDGFIGIFDDPVGNPVYRLTGDTAEKTYIGQCWWGYDMHFSYWKECVETVSSGAGYGILKPGEEYHTEYEIFAMTQEQSKPIMKKTVMQPLHTGKLEDPYKSMDRPIYVSGVNRFNKSIAVDDMDSFLWDKYGKGAIWEKGFGYDDNFSIKLYNPDQVTSMWRTRVGSEQFMEPLEAGKSYKLSGYMYTGGTTVKNLKIFVKYGILLRPDVKTIEHERVADVHTGTNWEYFEFVTPPVPEKAIWADIGFSLPSTGCIWFDNVEFARNMLNHTTICQ